MRIQYVILMFSQLCRDIFKSETNINSNDNNHEVTRVQKYFIILSHLLL